jgi:hypothetical protein
VLVKRSFGEGVPLTCRVVNTQVLMPRLAPVKKKMMPGNDRNAPCLRRAETRLQQAAEKRSLKAKV